jgi:hypothetical protein
LGRGSGGCVFLAKRAEGVVDFLLRASGNAHRAYRRAAVEPGRANGRQVFGLLRPGLALLAGSSLAQCIGDAEALAFGTAVADDDIIVGRARAGVGAIDDDLPRLGALGGGGRGR